MGKFNDWKTALKKAVPSRKGFLVDWADSCSPRTISCLNHRECNSKKTWKFLFFRMEGRPCHTIYINNINDKIKKMELLRQIYSLCSTYGQVKFQIVVRLPLKFIIFKVLDIMISKAPKLRGQAFVTFKEISDASAAIKRLQVITVKNKSHVQWIRLL